MTRKEWNAKIRTKNKVNKQKNVLNKADINPSISIIWSRCTN